MRLDKVFLVMGFGRMLAPGKVRAQGRESRRLSWFQILNFTFFDTRNVASVSGWSGFVMHTPHPFQHRADAGNLMSEF
jgi:hypothetical protein